MIVTAMLAWFNETPAELDRAVTSLAAVADRVIAVDGGWNYYPGAAPSSPPEQADAIRSAARNIGIQADIHPGRAWSGQVEKRNHMLQLAADGSDWVMPLDADWVIRGDREQVRAELEATSADAIVVDFYTPLNPDADLEDVAATTWHAQLAGEYMCETLIWRALPGMRVEDHHWFYSGVRDGERVALWGCHGRYPQAQTVQLQARFRIDHMCFFRDSRTIQANREYCEARGDYVLQHGREP